MSNPFVAEIRMFGGSFAPTGWAQCNGQLLPISQNTALFSLLGTFYGGDGKSTFALPNLEGSTPIGQGQGSGLSDYVIGQSGGSQFVTLLQSEIPAHNHNVQVYVDDLATQVVPGPLQVVGKAQGGSTPFAAAASPGTTMALNAFSVVGGSLPHNNMSPYLTVTFIIALQGVFPPRG